jgi:hypothetical protein
MKSNSRGKWLMPKPRTMYTGEIMRLATAYYDSTCKMQKSAANKRSNHMYSLRPVKIAILRFKFFLEKFALFAQVPRHSY